MAKMRPAQKTVSSVSFAGREYKVDRNFLDVPDEAIPHMLAMGHKLITDDVAYLGGGVSASGDDTRDKK